VDQLNALIIVEVPITNKISTSRHDLGQSKAKQIFFRGALREVMKIAKNLVILSLELKLL